MNNNHSKLSKVERAIELFGIISLLYLLFIVLYGHVGFILHRAISSSTLQLSFTSFVLLNCLVLALSKALVNQRKVYFYSLLAFVIFSFLIYLIGVNFFSQTYDTSWDGQGYHSRGIINMTNGWNPIYQNTLPIYERNLSTNFPNNERFVQGYPKTLWLIQSSIYAATGKINSAKVVNLAIVIIASSFSYILLRRLKISALVSLFTTILVVIQTPLLTQLVSFMADGFSYEMIVIALSSLAMFAIDKKMNTSSISFVVAELFLVGTKFSNIPLALGLGIIFLVMIIRKVENEKFIVKKELIVTIITCGSLFAFIPYATNIVFHNQIFYPTNLKEVSDSYKNDNVPVNLYKANRMTLLFYGIFSQSQTKEMGKEDRQNIAVLKIPFSFSEDEMMNSSSIFNNRVGGGGVLFSGIVLLSILTVAVMFFKKQTDKKSYTVLRVMTGFIGLFIVVSLLNPSPNMLRYTSQILLIPFLVIITTLIEFKKSRIIMCITYLNLLTIFINISLYAISLVRVRISETAKIDAQLSKMKRDYSSSYLVKANNFYSNYIRLKENQINVEIVDNLHCTNQEILESTSYTTRFCKK